MTEKLSQFFSLLILLSIGLISYAQDKERGNQRKYYGEGGRELLSEDEINKQKAIVILEDGYRTFSHVGKVTELKSSNGGKLPELKALKSELGDVLSIDVRFVSLQIAPNDYGQLYYSKELSKEKSLVKNLSMISEDSIITRCESFEGYLNSSLLQAGLVDGSNSFFIDAEKELILEVTVNKLFIESSIRRRIEKVSGSFLLEFKDVYGTHVHSEKLDVSSNTFKINFTNSKVDESNCYEELSFSTDRAFLMYDLFQALAYKISYSSSIKNAVMERVYKISQANSFDQIILKQSSPKISGLKEVMSSIVTISTDLGHGSGCVISEDGYIVTNHHVAGLGGKKIEIILNDGRRFSGVLLRSDISSDLALVKVNSDHKFDFIQINDRSDISVGEEIRVIGTPGSLQLGQTVTAGIVSAIRNNNGLELIQTDAHISPGNSGGAMINADGQLVGIVSSKAIGMVTEGVGFSIPIEYIKSRLNIIFQ